MDTEADSLHSYPERLCLVQLSFPGGDELIDPLAGFSLQPLWDCLRQRELIMHGADYDLRLLHRCGGFIPHAIFDTMLAERFLGGTEFGLYDLALRCLNVTLEKGPQKANWARRPLTERMAVYAQNDTRYLHPIASQLRARLEEKNRLAWHRETCDQLIAICTAPRTQARDDWRIKGSERLDRRGLAVLRELWHWRESEAIEAHKPPYFILSHEVVADIAAHSANSVEQLIPAFVPARRRAGLLEAVNRGLAVPEAELPEKPKHIRKKISEAAHRRLDQLKNHRDEQAARLGLDPSFIASRATLINLADNWELHSKELMNWQRELLRLDSKTQPTITTGA